jgi:hypothetical protein
VSRFGFASVALVAVLAFVPASCGNGGHTAARATAGTQNTLAPCKLSRAQRHTVAVALADIRRLRRIQAPMRTFSQHGAPHQNEVTGEFMLDVGRSHLPLNVFAHLIHLAKTAASLCGDCTSGLEADEPYFGSRLGATYGRKGRCG